MAQTQWNPQKDVQDVANSHPSINPISSRGSYFQPALEATVLNGEFSSPFVCEYVPVNYELRVHEPAQATVRRLDLPA